MHFNTLCMLLNFYKHQKTHLEEPLAMLVENSFEVKSCFSRAGHNFSRFSRTRVLHFKFRSNYLHLFPKLLRRDFLTRNYLYTYYLRANCIIYKYFISGVFRSMTKNPRQSPNRRGGENRRRRMRTSLVPNSHKE